jgi:hypothetical protein
MLAHRLSQAPDSPSKPQLQLATLPGDPPVAYPSGPGHPGHRGHRDRLIPHRSPCEPVCLMPDENVLETHMSSQPQDTLTVIAVLVMISSVFAVTHWRTVLRVILVMIVALAAYGAITIIYGLTSVMAAHHG